MSNSRTDKANHDSRKIRALHLFVITALAVSQPLFQLLSVHTEFIAAHRLNRLDLWILITTLALLLPSLPSLLYAVLLRLSAKMAHGFYLSWLLLSITTVLIQPLYASLGPTLLALALAMAGAVMLSLVLRRSRLMRQFLSLYVVALPVYITVLMASDTLQTDYRTPADQSASLGAGAQPDMPLPPVPQDPSVPLPHVILLVLDEFPLLSLLDVNGDLNTARFPNFAALSESGVWFKRHTANSESTSTAVPMILSGRQQDMSRRTIPDHRHYPDNLFTRLHPRYAVHAVQNGTDLCPSSICNPPAMFATRLGRLMLTLDDLAVYFGHRTLPKPLRNALPPIDQRWYGFRQAHEHMHEDYSSSEDFKPQNYSYENRIEVFRSFMDAIIPSDQPQFHYLHILLPHGPYRYETSILEYTLPEQQSILGIMPEGSDHTLKHQWYDDPETVALAERQQLLQVSAVDQLLGELVQHLKHNAMYDNTLLVVTSDHGAAFDAGGSRRQTTSDNFVRIASVPLFIKYPQNQPSGLSDWHTYSTDLGYLILTALNGDVPVVNSLHDNNQSPWPDRTHTRLQQAMGSLGQLSLSEMAEVLRQLAREQADRVGEGGPDSLWHGPDPHALVGQPLQQLTIRPIADSEQIQAQVARLDWMRNWNPYPGYTLGMLYADIADDSLQQRQADYVVAVNGHVVGSGRNVLIDGQRQHLRMLLNPAVFQSGENDVQLFEVLEDGRTLSPLSLEHADKVSTLRDAGRARRWLPPVVALTPGETLTFEDNRHEAAFYEGWATARSHILWSTATQSAVNLTFGEHLPAGHYRVTLNLKPFLVAERLLSQRMRIHHQDNLVLDTVLEKDAFADHAFDLTLTDQTRTVRLVLELPDAARPADFDINNDDRSLAIALLSLKLEAAEQ